MDDNGTQPDDKERLHRVLAELRQSKQQLEDALADLRQSNRELEQFAQVAAHDLKAPLRNIGAFSGLLAEEYTNSLDERGQLFLEHILLGVEQMQALLDDLLVYARAGTSEPDFAPVELSDAFAEAMEMLTTVVIESDAQVECGELPQILADRTQMGQLLLNLVGYALKYRGEQSPRVTVSAARGDDAMWTVSVRDNGIGIDPLYSEQIFETFRRLHGSGEYPGTGIGLAICKRIVSRHGGRIWAESEPGEGSTFHVTLPALPGTP